MVQTRKGQIEQLRRIEANNVQLDKGSIDYGFYNRINQVSAEVDQRLLERGAINQTEYQDIINNYFESNTN